MKIRPTDKNGLRILHIYDRYVPHLGYIENYLPGEEARLGNDVLVLVSRLLPAKSNTIMEDLAFKNGPNYVEFTPITVSSLISQFRPDIVFLPYFNPAIFFTVLLKKKVGHKVICTIGMTIDRKKTKLHKLLFYELMRRIVGPLLNDRVDLFIESTPLNKKRDELDFLIENDAVRFVPLGCDIEAFHREEQRRNETRKDLGVDTEEILFVYAGKLYEDKNISMMIEAFAELVKKKPTARLMIIGNGSESYEAHLKDQTKRHGIEDRMVWIDLLPHSVLPKYLGAADIGIWPGAPSISIQEAIACSLPVILPKSEHTSHLIKYGNGIEFASMNELKKGMEVLAFDPVKRLEMSSMSRKLAEDELAWSKIAESMNTIYAEVIRGSQDRRNSQH